MGYHFHTLEHLRVVGDIDRAEVDDGTVEVELPCHHVLAYSREGDGEQAGAFHLLVDASVGIGHRHGYGFFGFVTLINTHGGVRLGLAADGVGEHAFNRVGLCCRHRCDGQRE